MKPKISRGNSFGGLVEYVIEDENAMRGEIVGGNMAGDNKRMLMQEFAVVRRLRPDAVRPVWHCSLALPKGEKLSSSAWKSVCKNFMKKMGFSEFTPYVVVRHSDTDYDHVHIIASRISFDSKLWVGHWDVRTAIEAAQAIEKEHGLTITKGFTSERAQKKKLTTAEVQIAQKTGEEPPRLRLQRWVDDVVLTRPSALKFAELLRDRGVTVRANIASTGAMNGFSFAVDGIAFKGSNLGKAYSWAGLQSRGVTYDQKRDAGLSEYRAGVEPPLPVVVDMMGNRLQLQKWISIEIAKKSTAVEFAKSLRGRGVIVSANIASTGTMNGFSYEINGASFKSSAVGSNYTWAELQKSGISYDKVRDAEGLREFRCVEKVEKSEDELVQESMFVRKAHFAAKAVERVELNKTGEEQPRVRLQRWVDEVVLTRPSALKFAELLRDRGVVVRANIASTGTMNGFSFAVDGIAFKGSDLGKNYTWSGLQARGVTYDQKRDAGLSEYRAGVEPPLPVVLQTMEVRDAEGLREFRRVEKVGKSEDELVQESVAQRPTVPSYDEYLFVRKAHFAAKAVERTEIKKTHVTQISGVLSAQKKRRVALFEDYDFSGKPELKSIIRSLLAAEQAKEKAALKARQKSELDALNQRQFFPSYPVWKSANNLPDTNMPPRFEGKNVRAEISDIRDFVGDVRGQHIHYSSANAESAFIDKGREIAINDCSRASILASLQLSAQKWGRFSLVGGDDAFRTIVVELVAEHGFYLINDDLRLRVQERWELARTLNLERAMREPAAVPVPGAALAARDRLVEVKQAPQSAAKPTLFERLKSKIANTPTPMDMSTPPTREDYEVPVAPVSDSYAVTPTAKWMDLTDYGLSVFKVHGEKYRHLVVAGASVNHYEHELTQMGFTPVGEHFRVPLTIESLTLSRWRQAFPNVQIIKIDAREILIDEATLKEFLEANPVDSYDVTTLQMEPRQNDLEAAMGWAKPTGLERPQNESEPEPRPKPKW